MRLLLVALLLVFASPAEASLTTMGAGTVYTPAQSSDFPDASTTGVPAGTSLTTVSGDLFTSANNQMITAKDVSGCIVIDHYGVTVENSRARCITVPFGSASYDTANPPATIRDSEVDCNQAAGGAPSNSGIASQNFSAIRVEIIRCENGFDAGDNVTVEDSFVHNPYQLGGVSHTDGIQVWDGDNLTLEHNTFYAFVDGCEWPDPTGICNGSSALNINNDPTEEDPPISNVHINNNLIAGGGISLYCARAAVDDYNVTNNHFSTIFSPVIGDSGPSTDCSTGGETLSGNVYHETGEPIDLP